MVNKTVFEYFRNNRGKYPLDALKAKAIAAGYPMKDINDAIVMTTKSAEHIKPKLKVKLNSASEAKPSAALKPSLKVKLNSASGGKSSALFKTAGIFAILFFVMYLALLNAWIYFDVDLAKVFGMYLAIPFGLLFGVYFFGFYKIGVADDSSALRISSIIKICLGVLLPVIYLLIRPLFLSSSGRIGGLSAGVFLAYSLLFVGANYYFAIALLKNSKESRFSKPSGVFNLIYSIVSSVVLINALFLYFTNGSFSFTISEISTIYWEFIVLAVFAISSYFFEAMTFFLESKK